jgi:hypothetical protein
MRFLILVLALSMAACGSAVAAGRTVFAGTVDEREVCGSVHVWTAEDAGVPEAVAAILAATGPQAMVRTCEDLRHAIHIFVRSPAIIPQRGGVCRMREEEIFPDTSAAASIGIGGRSVKGWRRTPPPDWLAEGYKQNDALVPTTAFVGDVPCPPPDDPRYIPAENVTNGTLIQFDRLWQRITASDAALRQALRPLPVGPALPSHEEQLRERAVKAILEKPALTDIRCNFGVYDDFPACEARTSSFGLIFDVGPNGLMLQEVAVLTPY